MNRVPEIQQPIRRAFIAISSGMLLAVALSLVPRCGWLDPIWKIAVSNIAAILLYWNLSPAKERQASWVPDSVLIDSTVGTLIVFFSYLTLSWALGGPSSDYIPRIAFTWFAADAFGKFITVLLSDGRRAKFRRSRQDNSQCVSCGYSLKGNVSGTCPECGEMIPPSHFFAR